MNILDTFFILFKSDTTDLEKGKKQATKTTKDLNEEVKKTQKDTDELAFSFLDLAQKAAGAVGVVVGVGSAVRSVFGAEVQAAQIGMFTRNTGVAVGEMDSLSQATQRFGGTLEGALATAKRIQLGLTFQTPYGGAGDYTPMPTEMSIAARRYGIKAIPGMTPKDFLDQVNKKFQGMAPNQSLKIGEALGLDQATILLLQQTTKEYQRIYAESERIGLLTRENTEKAFAFYQQWQNVSQEIRNAGIAVGGPVMTGLDFLIDNAMELAKAAGIVLIAWAPVATIFAAAGFPALLASLIAGAAAVGAFAAAVIAATWPFLLFAAAVAGLWAVMKYGPQIFKSLGDAADKVFGKIKTEVIEAVEWFKELFSWITKGSDQAEKFGSKGKPSKDGQGRIDEYNQQELMLKAAAAMKAAGATQIGAQSSNSILNNSGLSSSVKIDKIEIVTQATDAEGIAFSVRDTFSRHINFAINNYNNGIRA
jgi:hypothetical protein